MSKDTIALTMPMSTFEGKEDLLKFVTEKIETITKIVPDKIKPLSEIPIVQGYVVEFPLYTSFPEFIAVRETRFEKSGGWIICKVRHREIDALPSLDGSSSITKIKMAYLAILIVPYNTNALKKGNPQTVYDYAEEVANDYISQYKLLPDRHNHDLKLRNNTNSGMISPVHKVSLKPDIDLISADAMFLGDRIGNISRNNVDLLPDELGLMLGSLNTMNDEYIWRSIQAPIYRLIQAFDANCYGEADNAISLAASSIEGFLMATQIVIRVHQYGEDEETVSTSVRNKSLAELVTYAVNQYGLNNDKTSERTAYGKWHHRCYKKRNEYIHKQYNFKSNESRSAIASTANLVSHITTLIAKKHRNYSNIAFYTKLITKSLK